MNARDFTSLYTKQSTDETLTAFQNETGFSLIRLYPENTPYNKDGRRMFIKVAILNQGFFYDVNMTKLEKRNDKIDYIITDGEEYKKKVTNFFSDGGSNEFIFNEESKKIKHTKTQRELTLNEFVEILAKNHLSDRLSRKRKMNWLASIILKILFGLADKHYDTVKVSIDKYNFNRDNKPTTEEQKNIEPFFKYFYISKNLIFAILLLSFLIAILVAIFPDKIPFKQIWHSLFGEFSLSNPMVVLLFFLALFSSEKLSIWIKRGIQDFLTPEQDIFSEHKEGFVEKLHNYQHHNRFNLKL